MPVTLYNIYEATLLVVNAITVLHEQRFLDQIGWGRNQMQNQMNFGQAQQPGFKQNLIQLIHSIRTVMRPPLIILNTLTILLKLVAG